MSKRSPDESWFRDRDATAVVDGLVTSLGNRLRRWRKVAVVEFLVIAGLVAYIILVK